MSENGYGPSARYKKGSPDLISTKSEPKLVVDDISTKSGDLSESNNMNETNQKMDSSDVFLIESDQDLIESKIKSVNNDDKSIIEKNIKIEIISTNESTEIENSTSSSIPDVTEPVVKLSLEDSLRLEVQQEFEKREIRLVELSKLQNELSQTLAKKTEVELVIERELKALFPRLKDEFFKETARVDQLINSLTKFKDASVIKKEIISNEENVLAQMIAVRENIKETTILNQLDEAINTKKELVDIESSICKEIDECAIALEEQINDTRNKLSSLNNAITSLPSLEDKNSMRAYTWQDVSNLQTALYTSMESSSTRDGKVEEFVIKFEDAMRQKGIVLGENTDLSPILTAATGVRSSLKKSKNLNKSMDSETFNKQAASLEQTTELMKTKSNEDLAKAAADAFKRSFIGLGTLTGNFVNSAITFFDSDDGIETVAAGKESIEAVKDTGASIQNVAKVTQKAWEIVVTDDNDPSFRNVVKGVQGILKNDDVKVAFSDVKSNVSRGSMNANKALSKVTSTAAYDLKKNKMKEAFFELQEGLAEFLGVTIVATQRVAGELQQQSRQLPPIR
jgi:hypothetical protein